MPAHKSRWTERYGPVRKVTYRLPQRVTEIIETVAYATIVALRIDDSTFSTHTLIAQDDVGDNIRWIIERGHYDIRTLQDAERDAQTR